MPRTQFNVRIPAELKKKTAVECKRCKTSRGVIVELALEDWFMSLPAYRQGAYANHSRKPYQRAA